MQFSELSALPARAASSIHPLFVDPNRERYVRFLQTMFQYTKESEGELRHASTLFEGSSRELFETLAQQESSHYRLARADLRALDADVEDEPSAAVAALRDFWMSTELGNAHALLGALFVFENVGAHLQELAMSSLASLGLGLTQTCFVRVHLEADEEHGRLVGHACEEAFAEHGPAMLQGAQRAAELWVQMHLAVVDTERV